MGVFFFISLFLFSSSTCAFGNRCDFPIYRNFAPKYRNCRLRLQTGARNRVFPPASACSVAKSVAIFRMMIIGNRDTSSCCWGFLISFTFDNLYDFRWTGAIDLIDKPINARKLLVPLRHRLFFFTKSITHNRMLIGKRRQPNLRLFVLKSRSPGVHYAHYPDPIQPKPMPIYTKLPPVPPRPRPPHEKHTNIACPERNSAR